MDEDDFAISSYNPFDSNSYKNIVYLYRKYVIGVPEDLRDELQTTKKALIIDFKTKSIENFKNVKAYDEQAAQLAAYKQGFRLQDAQCFNLFLSTHNPGDFILHEWTDKDIEKGWRIFENCLYLWKEKNGLGG